LKAGVEAVGMAKSAIDHGFSRVGNKLMASDPVERVLSGLAGRAIAIGNAVSLLCGRQHANEALPLLRSLLEISARMRWIAEDDSRARAEEYIKEAARPQWDGFLAEDRLRSRMGKLGYSAALMAMTETLCLEHLRANALGIPWGHVFEENKHAGRTGEEVTRAAGEAMAHVVMALHKRWGEFPGSDEILRAAEAVQQERKS
jgi:hypothetical protein